MKVTKWIKENWITIILFGCFLLMHCYRLSSIPRGMCVDEAAAAYDGWCLHNFGTDRELRPYPIYFKNFGGGQSVLYAYILSVLFHFFDMSLAIIRIPVLVFTTLFVIYGIRIIRLYHFSSKLPEYLFLASVSFMPVFVVMFRVGLDCHLMLGLSTMFLFYLIKGIETNLYRYYVLAGFCSGLVLYSYILSHLVLPCFLLLTIIYLIRIRKFHFTKWIVLGIPLCIFAIPLLAFHITNMMELPDTPFGPFTLTRLWCYNDRSSEMSLSNFLSTLPIALRDIFLFDDVRFNTVTSFFNVYAPTIIFFVIGFGIAIRQFIRDIARKTFSLHSLLLFWWICEFLLACITDTLSTYKVNAIFFCVLMFAIEGVIYLKNKKNKIISYLLIATAIFYCIRGAQFTHYYFTQYPIDTWPIYLFGGTMNEVADYLSNISSPEDHEIYFGEMNKPQIYYAIATHQHPEDYQNIDPDNGNLHFYLPKLEDGYDVNAIYVVQNSETAYCDKLSQIGFVYEVCGEYLIYTHPWSTYTNIDAEIPFTIDHSEVNSDQNLLKFSGWSVNSINGTTWDEILVQIDDKIYTAAKTTRNDVANVLGSDIFLQSGYQVAITVPLSTSDMHILFIDNKNQICYRSNLILE